jgi:hypothetical protein
MADGLTITVDTAALLAALDQVPDRVLAKIRGQAHLTAQRIAREARGRIHRRTGRTAGGITVSERRDGRGYRVETSADPDAGRPISLEFGTQVAAARPFLFISADLEANSHDQRMRAAIVEALDEAGLGDA